MATPEDDSILDSMKQLLGYEKEDHSFDLDIQLNINAVFSVLHQIGASPPEGFMISGSEEKWSDFLENRMHVEFVKIYMLKKLQLAFDPPPTSFGITSIESQIREYESRLNYMELTFNPNAYGPRVPIIIVVPKEEQ